MKVITEESLRHVLKMHFGFNDVNQSICSHFINELQEIDTLTVSKLRPMSDAPRDRSFLGYYKGISAEYFEIMYISTVTEKIRSIDDEFDDDDVLGWIPMPVYKPEEIIWPNACG